MVLECGYITARGTPCQLPKKKCYYHSNNKTLSDFARWKRQNPNNRFKGNYGQYVCGALLTGHSRPIIKGKTRCTIEVEKSTGTCHYHTYCIKKRRNIKTNINYRGNHLRKQLFPRRSLKKK